LLVTSLLAAGVAVFFDVDGVDDFEVDDFDEPAPRSRLACENRPPLSPLFLASSRAA